ncbi:hypothetical protein AB0L00_23470 [Actinoallomurus sp. NPDC052308]|uniref:hypothetical protein n=1 Tax=Actinoallomurus sp. NPDC052308 TaxID=3155530 RepID=UPI00342198B7
MTLRADLIALLADAGIVDVDIDEAVEDEHVRSSAYRKVVAVIAGAQRRDNDRAVVSVILRDPEELVSKTALVDFVDRIAMNADGPTVFRQWAVELMPEIDQLKADGHRRFLHGRIHDWTIYLTVMTGRTPAAGEMVSVTDWMQRRIATQSTSPSVLAVLAEMGSTKKIRNVARNRAASRAVGNER